jgi:hypothetical protein
LRHQLLARLTLLVGIFCVLSQISGALHWVLVEHAQCAEHGEWVHVGQRDDPHSEASSARDSACVEAGGRDAHGHHHCDFLPGPRELALVPSAEHLPVETLVVDARGDVQSSDSRVLTARYELAPKTSPPRAS